LKISQIYKNKKTVFSCEVFPPKRDDDINTVLDTIKELQKLEPDFVSVTYGAGGSTKDNTVEISSRIKNDFSMESLMHLTCIDTKTEDIIKILDKVQDTGIENILALRGDIPNGIEKENIVSEFCYAIDLVKFIKKHNDFCVGVAGYPEKHPEAYNYKQDIINLKKKVDAGADFIISQLFFKNDYFYRFMDEITSQGIDVPVSAGIMPVFKAQLVQKMVSLCGATIPAELNALIEKYGDKPQEMEKTGVDYASEQISGLLANKVRGIHLYTMNKPKLAFEISGNTGLR